MAGGMERVVRYLRKRNLPEELTSDWRFARITMVSKI